ncbi:MAG: efflux RND transporter periplasmic adaptor subunit [Ignavibacteriae bacterium]|nr:efflux RND transporter periplasmic adaptor subunit [Ignavibacteriota bacterium]
MNIIYQSKILLSLLFLLFMLLLGCGKREQEQSEMEHGEHESEFSENTTVHLDMHKVYHAGIKVETVEKKSVAIPLTIPGKVSFNERKQAHITSRLAGRIEHVYAFTNDNVTESEVLAELFSQEFLTMQSEFLQVVARLNRLGQSGEDNTTTKALYESSKKKLKIVGLTENELKELETSLTPQSLYRIHAPFKGTVLESKIKLGSYVELGTELFDYADLSTVWILADVFENNLPYIKTGMRATIEVSAFPEVFEGTINSVYNVVDENTRTVKARIEVQNTSGKLKPEMFCTVKIQTSLGNETIKIPESALLGETEKHFVFIALNDSTFEKRDVRTGVETREFAEVMDGLLVGEKIVVKGGFFLKSELAKETFGEEH